MKYMFKKDVPLKEEIYLSTREYDYLMQEKREKFINEIADGIKEILLENPDLIKIEEQTIFNETFIDGKRKIPHKELRAIIEIGGGII